MPAPAPAPTPTEPASRSPSPTTSPPIAATPGPRAQGIINIFQQATKATLDKCSAANFAACFPTAAQHRPDVLEHVRGQIVDQLERTWTCNFEEIMVRRDVVRLLNALDQCIDDARLRKRRSEAAANGGPVGRSVPLHTLSPAEIHLAHLMPFLEKQAAEMHTRLTQTQDANAQLLATIQTQRSELTTLVQSLQNVVQDLEASAHIMEQDDVQGLSHQTRHVHVELRK